MSGGAVDFKRGIILDLQPHMARGLPGIDAAYRETVKREATITSGRDGSHMPTSLHYAGLAVDVRIRDPYGTWKLTPEELAVLHGILRLKLNGSRDKDVPYNVVLESTHFHVEYDPD